MSQATVKTRAPRVDSQDPSCNCIKPKATAALRDMTNVVDQLIASSAFRDVPLIGYSRALRARLPTMTALNDIYLYGGDCNLFSRRTNLCADAANAVNPFNPQMNRYTCATYGRTCPRFLATDSFFSDAAPIDMVQGYGRINRFSKPGLVFAPKPSREAPGVVPTRTLANGIGELASGSAML